MACDKEHPFGIFCYADMLEFGKGVKKDEPQAARLYKKAAYLRHDVSQTRYGLILEKGKFGVKTDLKEAVRSYKTASDQGSPEGMFNFADMLEFGKGVPKNPNAAIQLYKLAAQKGHSKSVAYLRFLMTQGVIMPRDIKAGQTLLVALAEAGEKPLAGAYMLKAAVFLLIGEGGVKKDSVF
jgi:TPR repeat protein